MCNHGFMEDPHGISLKRHATIAAELGEGELSPAEVLETHGIGQSEWNEASQFWMARLGEDALENGANARLALIYSDAFARAQDALAAPPTITPEDYAALVVDIMRYGGPHVPLSERGLSTADYIRMSRYFAARFAREPMDHRRYVVAFERLQPKT